MPTQEKKVTPPLHDISAAALRGDDTFSRVAGDVAAPRRRLLAALRDAHAEAMLHIAALRRCDAALASGDSPLRAVLARLLGEAEEGFHRLEMVFARLNERPGAGLAAPPGRDLLAILAGAGPDRDAAFLLALAAMERGGAEEARRLRHLASTAGEALAARLLDLTAAEREGMAAGLERLVSLRGAKAGAARH